MAKIPEGASRIRNVKGEVIGYTLKGKKHYFDKDRRPVEPTSGRSLVYSTGEKGKKPINRSHGGAGADWSKLMTKKSTSADEKPPEPEKKQKPEKKTESEVRTLTNNNRNNGGGGGGNNTTPNRPPRNNSAPTPPKRPTGQGSQGFRMKRDLGKELKISTPGKTESKPKSRLEKATSGIGKWKEPEKKKRTPNKNNRSKWRR